VRHALLCFRVQLGALGRRERIGAGLELGQRVGRQLDGLGARPVGRGVPQGVAVVAVSARKVEQLNSSRSTRRRPLRR
jgi:hypothetical protein